MSRHRRKLRDRVVELEIRVEGLETMLADLIQAGRIVVQLPSHRDDELTRLVRQVEAEQHRPSIRRRLG